LLKPISIALPISPRKTPTGIRVRSTARRSAHFCKRPGRASGPT